MSGRLYVLIVQLLFLLLPSQDLSYLLRYLTEVDLYGSLLQTLLVYRIPMYL